MVSKLSPPRTARSSPISRPILPILLRYQDYLNIPPEDRHLYTYKPKTPSTSPSSPKQYPPSPPNKNPPSPPNKNPPSPPNKNPPSPPSLNNNDDNKRKSTGGVNLTPLISALLLAGIKLALDKKKKANATKSTKSAKSASKSTKSAKAAKATKPLKRQRKTI